MKKLTLRHALLALVALLGLLAIIMIIGAISYDSGPGESPRRTVPGPTPSRTNRPMVP